MFEGALRVSAHSHTVLRLFFRRLGFLPLGFNPLRFPLKRLYEFFCGLGRRKVNISGCAKGVPDHAPGIVYPVAVFFLPPERTGLPVHFIGGFLRGVSGKAHVQGKQAVHAGSVDSSGIFLLQNFQTGAVRRGQTADFLPAVAP